MNDKKKIKDYLDNAFSDDGFKSDITITLTHQTLIRASAYMIGTALVITLLVHGVNGLVKNAK